MEHADTTKYSPRFDFRSPVTHSSSRNSALSTSERISVTGKRLRLTQAQAASKKGLCRTWIAKIESCEVGLDLLGFVKLCGVYGIRASEMIGIMGKAP